MKLNKKYLNLSYIIVVFILLTGLFFLNNNTKTKETATAPANVQEKSSANKPRNYSLINFFHRSAYVCSLAIPEDWEGHYRKSESDNIVYFNYLNKDGNTDHLFSISYADLNSKPRDNEIELIRNDKYVYFSEKENKSKNNDPEFTKMKNDSESIRSSLKCTISK